MDLKIILTMCALWLLRLAFPEIYSFTFGKILEFFLAKTRSLISHLGKKKEKKFREVIRSKKYKEFVSKIIKKYYLYDDFKDIFFTEVNGMAFPVTCFKGAPIVATSSIRDFDSLCDKKSSNFTFELSNHKQYQNYGYYKEYSSLFSGLIKYPDRPGYMLDELEFNGRNEVAGIRAHIGTFAENVYSSHVLEYELYKIYIKFKDKDIDNSNVWMRIIENFKRRNSIHNGVDNLWKSIDDSRESKQAIANHLHKTLKKIYSAHSLLSVQMLVIIKSSITHEYELKIIERSSKTVNCHGIYQFVPAGGFEVLNDSEDGVYSENELNSEFSPGCAVFREYLEELLNRPEFEGNSTGNVGERLLKDPAILEIEKMIADGRATLQFLGSIVGLEMIRHELSFLLFIDDESYDSRNKFIANYECKKGRIEENVTVENFESQEEIWRNIHAPSAAMWHLFKKTDIYKKLIANK